MSNNEQNYADNHVFEVISEDPKTIRCTIECVWRNCLEMNNSYNSYYKGHTKKKVTPGGKSLTFSPGFEVKTLNLTYSGAQPIVLDPISFAKITGV